MGGGILASPKLRCLGYLVLLNRCNTMQMRPASTAMPEETPSSVGKSELSSLRSVQEEVNDSSVRLRAKCHLTRCAKDPPRWLRIADRMIATGALTHRIVPHLNTEGVLIVVDAGLVVETLIAQFLS